MQEKTYIGFLNDESGSMSSLRQAATRDYNANIAAIKAASTRTMQDTIVSMFTFGGWGIVRKVVNSNPHVLNALKDWNAGGGTPGREAIKEMIEMFKSLPDAKESHVSFVVFTTSDGDFNYGGYPEATLAREIAELTATGRWTFVFRAPAGGRRALAGLNIPAGNIQEWDTTEAGMAKSTAQTTQAFDTFFTARAAGTRSSSSFYADATNVDTSKLVDITDRVSLYQVENYENGIQIRDFILKRRQRYLKGSAFYQLMKTEPRVQPTKMIAVRDRTTLKIYAGPQARAMLGLSSVDNVRLHPGDHGNFDIFIQSESVNRKLVAPYGVLYWEEIGVPFTQEEIDRFTKPADPKPAVVQLPAVAPTNKPTPNPLKPTPKATAKAIPMPAVNGRVRYHVPPVDALFYSTRDIAREVAHSMPGKKQYDAGPGSPHGRRFFVAAA